MKIESKRKALWYLAAIFLAGLVIGAAGGFTLAVVWKFKMPSIPQIEAKAYESLKKKLELRADQEGEVKAAVHEMTLEIGEAFKDLGTRSRDALVKCQGRIEPILDAKQRDVLSHIVAEHQKTNPDLKSK